MQRSVAAVEKDAVAVAHFVAEMPASVAVAFFFAVASSAAVVGGGAAAGVVAAERFSFAAAAIEAEKFVPVAAAAESETVDATAVAAVAAGRVLSAAFAAERVGFFVLGATPAADVAAPAPERVGPPVVALAATAENRHRGRSRHCRRRKPLPL